MNADLTYYLQIALGAILLFLCGVGCLLGITFTALKLIEFLDF